MLRACSFAASVAVVTLALAACGGSAETGNIPSVDTSNTLSMNIWEVAQRVDAAPSFMTALRSTGAYELLAQSAPHTIFLPENARMARLTFRDSLAAPSGPDPLLRTLELHLVRGRIVPENVADSQMVSTLSNLPVKLMRRGDDSFSVEGIPVLRTIPAQNGVVYLIEEALALPTPDTTVFLAPEP